MSLALAHAFENFATFGSSVTTSPVTCDNAHFAKLCRDCKIIDKKVTAVDVDIVFKKVVTKGERRITYHQFEQALKELSKIKYGAAADGNQRIQALITTAAPTSSGTEANASGVFSKLTDTTQYTGTHKERFDADGNGRGLAGRETHTTTATLSQMVDRTIAPVSVAKPKSGNKRAVTVSMEAMNNKPAQQRNIKPASGTKNYSATKPGSKKVAASTSTLSNSTAAKASANSLASNKSSGGSVYDRLTDTKGYTGTHKERFDSNGNGRGLAGRDTHSRTADLSLMVNRR